MARNIRIYTLFLKVLATDWPIKGAEFLMLKIIWYEERKSFIKVIIQLNLSFSILGPPEHFDAGRNYLKKGW